MIKVLIINNVTIGADSATGNTLYNLFNEMENVEVLQYTLVDKRYTSENQRTLKINTIYNDNSSIINRIIHKFHKSKNFERSNSLENTSIKRFLRSKIKALLLSLYEMWPQSISNSTYKLIEDYSPDVIYTLGADINVLKQAIELSEKYKINIVLHNMDDIYHTKFSNNGLLQSTARKKLRTLYQTVYTKSKCSIAIGPKMAEEYSKEFGIPFEWAMNCVDSDSIVQNRANKELGILLIFSGGLHGGRDSTLKKIAEEIEGSEITLEIYTSSRDYSNASKEFDHFNNTKLFRYVDESVYFENLQRATLLLHVESFEQITHDYFRLSMSTKIPEYCYNCRPILCVGPLDMSTVEFISNTEIGVSTSSLDGLHNIIESMTESTAYSHYINNEIELFKSTFRKESMQKKILTALKRNIRE